MAASMLAYDPADALTHDQHLALLRYLCDAALDSEKLRGVLQRERGVWRAPSRGLLGRCLRGAALVSEKLRGVLQRACVRALASCALVFCLRGRRARAARLRRVTGGARRRNAPPCLTPPPCAGREDEAADVKRDVREEMAENRRAIKEIMDAGGWRGRRGGVMEAAGRVNAWESPRHDRAVLAL